MSVKYPLIAFVNSKSGGQQGTTVREKLKKYIPAEHIFDLAQGGPAPGLSKFKEQGSRFRVLVCGGDGTVGWVLSEIQNLKFSPETEPPVAILPIGTGNDLSRTLKWGAGFSGKGVGNAIKQIEKACVVRMDKWKVTCTKTGAEGGITHHLMNNYLSIGSDAEIALQFHENRNAHPERHTSRAQNMAWYLRLGLANLSPEPIQPSITVDIDGQNAPIPENTRCVVVLNLPSYSAGANLWGPHKSRHTKRKLVGPAIDDGLLEVVAISGPMQIVAIHANVGRAKKLGQGKKITIGLRKVFATQIDGEPWRQQPANITIEHAGTSLMLGNTPPTRQLHASGGLSPVLSPLSAPLSPQLSSPLIREDGAVTSPEMERVLHRTRSSSVPIAHTPSPIKYGPVDPAKRKKNRLYCDGCGLEFFLPHMMENHVSSGLCGASPSSSSDRHSRANSTLSTDDNAIWRTQSDACVANTADGPSGDIHDEESKDEHEKIYENESDSESEAEPEKGKEKRESTEPSTTHSEPANPIQEITSTTTT